MDWTTNPNLNLLTVQNSGSCSQVWWPGTEMSLMGYKVVTVKPQNSKVILRCHAVIGQAVLIFLKALWILVQELRTPWCSYHHRRPEVSRRFKLQIFSIPMTNYLRIFYTLTGYFNVVLTSLMHGQRPSLSNVLCHVCSTALNFLQALH